MKTNLLLLFTLAAVGVSVITACSKSDSPQFSEHGKTHLKSSPLVQQGFPFPEGTVYSDNGNKIDFHLPEGSLIYGFSAAGQMVSGATGSLTCTCDGPGGCKPFTAGGKWGCLVDGCKSCTGKTSLTGLTEVDFFLVASGGTTENSELASLADSRPMFTIAEWQQTPFASGQDVESAAFVQALDRLNSYIDEHFARKNLVAIPFVVAGKKVLTDVPFEAIEPGMLYTLSVAAGAYNCSGTCGSSKCKKSTAAMGQVVYCDGCQSGCKLTASYVNHI